MIETLSRRKLIGGLGLLIAAPAIVRVASLMPVKAIPVGEGMDLTEAALESLMLYGTAFVQTRWTEVELFQALHIPANHLMTTEVG